jgi:TetR/AcrR family transcriptional repressor of nem operon
MRVSRAKAEENRRNVVEVASRLFRSHGFDGIGVSDLMKGAGLTQGGFYKQFNSKDDLIAEASAVALAAGAERWENLATKVDADPLAAIVEFYLSPFHREERSSGCAIAALGPEAIRQAPQLRETFQDGIERHLALLDTMVDVAPGGDVRSKSMVTLSTMVGALILSRAVAYDALGKRLLEATIDSVLRPTGGEQQRDTQ